MKDREGLSEPSPESIARDEWTDTSSSATYIWQEKETCFLLRAISGYGKVISITVNMNNDEFSKEIQAFMETIVLKKTEGYVAPNTLAPGNHNNTITQSKTPESMPAIEMGKIDDHGITISTTKLDDGWEAQPFSDYVRVTKGSIQVFLHYPVQITETMRASSDVAAYLFDQFMQPRYVVSNVSKYDNDGPCYFCIYFYEADVIEKSSNKKFHAGFRVLIDNGIARGIEILSLSRQDFQKEFPTQEKIEAMTGYNKFAVCQADLVGEWEVSSGAFVNMFSTVTGAYAGMNTSSSADRFIFKSDGSYFSNHKGAFGMVGNMQFYDQKYNGTYTVTNWDVTATKRFEGKTDVWWAQFEAVKGGSVLHLQDKKASAIQYHLVKKK